MTKVQRGEGHLAGSVGGVSLKNQFDFCPGLTKEHQAYLWQKNDVFRKLDILGCTGNLSELWTGQNIAKPIHRIHHKMYIEAS
jgi:hypothetical protein